MIKSAGVLALYQVLLVFERTVYMSTDFTTQINDGCMRSPRQSGRFYDTHQAVCSVGQLVHGL